MPFTDLFRSTAGPAAAPQGQPAGKREALAAAFARGEAAARAEAAQALAAQAAAHDRALKAVERRAAAAEAALRAASEHALQALEDAYLESLAPLAVAIARAVLAAEPALGTATLQSLLGEALSALPRGAAGTLFLAPGTAHPALPHGWGIIEDPAIAPGTLRAQVDATVVTASLERRLAQLAGDLA